MIKGRFEYIVASFYNREELVCEIYFNDVLVADLTLENEKYIIRLHSPIDKNFWEFPYEELLEAFEIGRKFLLGEKID